MQITKVSYGKTYPTGNYSSERIDLEATIDEGETITGVISVLKKMCDTEHQNNNPHLYQEQDTKYQHPISEINNYTTIDRTELRPVETPQPIDNQLTQEQKIHNLITQSTSLSELKQWELLSKNKQYPTLKEIYDNKLKELTNG